MTYFPIHGFRGLMPRLVMHLGEIPFTEKIIQVQDWTTVKPSKPRLNLENTLCNFSQQHCWATCRK